MDKDFRKTLKLILLFFNKIMFLITYGLIMILISVATRDNLDFSRRYDRTHD